MGWLTKLIVGLLGLLLIGGPLWPVALVCFLYLAFTLRPKKSTRKASGASLRPGASNRCFLALALLLLSAVAFASGGSSSPVVFLLGGLVALIWPVLTTHFPVGETVPVRNSILLRSKYFPIAWHAAAELKPGADSFPRALSSVAGTLLVFTDTGKTFVLATCLALERKDAETKLCSQLRSAAPAHGAGAYLLPLDGEAAASILRQRFSKTKLPSPDLVESASRVSGALLLECSGEQVQRANAYEIRGLAGKAKIPRRGMELETSPLLWEVLEGIGKRTRWPDPDNFSNLLDTLTATRGVPLGDRLKTIEGSDGEVSVQSLTGAEVRVTRPQLRAIISIYS